MPGWGIVIAPNIGRQQGPNNFVAQISKEQYTDVQMSIYLNLRGLAGKLSF